MSKYFKENETKKILLSKYLKKNSSELKKYFSSYDEENRIKITKYIMNILGDIKMDVEIYQTFIRQFNSWGGKYDVRTKPVTIQAMHEIIERFPELSARGVDEIWFVYIKDLFDNYQLIDMLEKYILIHGKTDEALEMFIDYVNKKADEYNKTFEVEKEKLESLKEEYGERFINFLQDLILRQHISYEKIINSIPASELIKEDQKQLYDLSKSTRIYWGVGYPISYELTEMLITDENLDSCPETFSYVINNVREVEAKFTKQQFLDSVKEKQNVKKLLKK